MASKPVILTVDDDPAVLRAVERDLRAEYARDYRVLRAGSGAAGLELCAQLGERGDVVAMFVSDHRMPVMDGVEFLAQAMRLFPDAKRVLLTAYADTAAAIRAINEVDLDHYLLKPWNPPEELLYPVLSDLLADWRGSYRPPFEGVRVVGDRWSPDSHRIKDFLGTNAVPYQWLDVEAAGSAGEQAAALLTRAGPAARLPLVLLSDDTLLTNPTTTEVAAAVGLQTQAGKAFYDLVIVGGGPAALAAGVYGASEGLSAVLIEKQAPGGQAGASSRIENYLGFPVGLSGADLTRRAVAQASRFGVEILSPQEVTAVRVADPYRVVTLADGTELSCSALLLATGVQWRRLDAPGIDRLTGAGVYYGAARTEALSSSGEDVYIVGGANSAGQAAMYFSGFARRVVLVVRGPSIEAGMSAYLVEQLAGTANIEVAVGTEVAEAVGDSHLQALRLRDRATGQVREVPAAALFLMIGAEPRTDWLDGVVQRDPRGFLLTGPDLPRAGTVRPDQSPPQRRGEGEHRHRHGASGWPLDRDPYLLETSVPGVFAAGDVRRGSVKRVASGVGEGSIAISFVHQYLAETAA